MYLFVFVFVYVLVHACTCAYVCGHVLEKLIYGAQKTTLIVFSFCHVGVQDETEQRFESRIANPGTHVLQITQLQ